MNSSSAELPFADYSWKSLGPPPAPLDTPSPKKPASLIEENTSKLPTTKRKRIFSKEPMVTEPYKQEKVVTEVFKEEQVVIETVEQARMEESMVQTYKMPEVSPQYRAQLGPRIVVKKDKAAKENGLFLQENDRIFRKPPYIEDSAPNIPPRAVQPHQHAPLIKEELQRSPIREQQPEEGEERSSGLQVHEGEELVTFGNGECSQVRGYWASNMYRDGTYSQVVPYR